MSSFHSRLKELREECGMSQKQFALLFEYSQGAVAHWELGTSEPPTAVLRRIAEYFRVTVDYLVGASDQRTAPAAAPSIPDSYVELSPFEKEVLMKYRILPPSEQVYICRMLQLTHPAARRAEIKQA